MIQSSPYNMYILSNPILCFILSGIASSIQYVREANVDEFLYDKRYVGCFFNESPDFTHIYEAHVVTSDFIDCIIVCEDKYESHYISHQKSSSNCFCIEDMENIPGRVPDDHCDELCQPFYNYTCGGSKYMSLYEHMKYKKGIHGNVLILLGLQTGVRLYPTSNTKYFYTLIHNEDMTWTYSVDYHFDKKLLFAKTGPRIEMIDVTAKFRAPASHNRPTVLQSSETLCDGFAVDWIKDKVYYGVCTSGRATIMSMDLDGSNVTSWEHLQPLGRTIKRMEVDPYVGQLFLLSDNRIESLNLTESNMTALDLKFHYNEAITAMSLDRIYRRIYYVSGGHLSRADYGGNSFVWIFESPQLGHVYGLTIYKNYVYWVSFYNLVNVVVRAPLSGDHNITTIVSTTETVTHMRVVQYDDKKEFIAAQPCIEKGCSHYCDSSNPSNIKCICNSENRLDKDNKTCLVFWDMTVDWTSKNNDLPDIEEYDDSEETPPKSVPKTYHNVTYMGCFGSQYPMIRQILFRVMHITLDDCFNSCVSVNVPLAGINARDKNCFCGTHMDPGSPKLDDGHCPVACPSVSNFTCGGDWHLSMYNISALVPGWQKFDFQTLLIGHSGNIKEYETTNMANPRVLFRVAPKDYMKAMDFDYQRKLLFAIIDNGISKFPLPVKDNMTANDEVGNVATPIVTGEHILGLAVDWIHGRVYYIEADYTVVNTFAIHSKSKIMLKNYDLHTENPYTIWTKDGFFEIRNMVIDPFFRTLFWINGHVIEFCLTNGSKIRTISSLKGISVKGITLDVVKQHLFFIGEMRRYESFYLFRSDYRGNHLVEIISNVDPHYSYGISKVRDIIYWTKYSSEPSTDNIDLYLATLEVRIPRKIRQFSAGVVLWGLTVVDPGIQPPPHPCMVAGHPECNITELIQEPKEEPVEPTDNSHGLVLIVYVVVVVVFITGVLFYTDIRRWLRECMVQRRGYVGHSNSESETMELNAGEV